MHYFLLGIPSQSFIICAIMCIHNGKIQSQNICWCFKLIILSTCVTIILIEYFSGQHRARSELFDKPELWRPKRQASCSGAGEVIAHENDCRKYHVCDDNLEPGEEQQCDTGQHFHTASSSCMLQGDAGCTLPGPTTCHYDRNPLGNFLSQNHIYCIAPLS